jgi:hypothetical protein
MKCSRQANFIKKRDLLGHHSEGSKYKQQGTGLVIFHFLHDLMVGGNDRSVNGRR